MNLTQTGQTYEYIDQLVTGSWNQNSIEQKAIDEPIQRRYHSAICHKSSIYIYGGIPKVQASDHFNQQRLMYRLNVGTKTWNKMNTNFLNNNSFSYIYAHSTIIYNNMMYLFGGKNYKNGNYIVGLWCLNLESFNWKRQELKCSSPPPRQQAAMVLHQRSMIVLYGGRSGTQNLNDLYVYKIQNKIWQQIQQSSYDFKITCRLKPALTSAGDHLYLFGGQRQTGNGEEVTNNLLNDFYQIKFLYRPMSTKPDVWIKSIIATNGPTQKVANFLNLHDKYLILWGEQNMVDGNRAAFPGCWLYNIAEVSWNWIKLAGSIEYFPTVGFTFSYSSQRFYIFGQYGDSNNQITGDSMVDVDVPKSNSSGMLSFGLDMKQIENKFAQAKLKPKQLQLLNANCNDCFENKNVLGRIKFGQFSILKEILNEKLQYVYSAFGLLVDNTLLLQAKDCRVIFNHTFKDKYFLIEDNGNSQLLWDNYSDFVSDLLIFKTYVQENIDQLEQMKQQAVTKKDFMKEEHAVPVTTVAGNNDPNNVNSKETREQRQLKQKENRDKEEEKELRKRKQQAKRTSRKKIEDRRQFSRNIKLGSLRIGDRAIYITKFGSLSENRRVFVLQKIQTTSRQYTYRTYYYSFQNNTLNDPNMQSAKKYIDQEYKIYFKIVNDRKDQASNFLFITNLKEIVNEAGQLEPELKESIRHSDVFCCEKRQLQSLQDGILIESIDISLKNYLSLLYLKSDELKISLTISEHRNLQISNLQIFEKIDNMVKTEKIIDLVDALDLQHCNIIEVYYNKANNNRARDMNRKTATFNFLNGILFYSKNRLICRYKFNLGEVNKLFRNKVKSIQQILIMFGFIQISDEFSINIFKTAFIRDDLLQQIYHRLRFVQKYAQRFAKDQITVRNRPLDDKNERTDKNEPRKRVKQSEGASSGQNQANEVIQID